MTDPISGCFIVPRALSLLRYGPGAPIWRAVTTLENAVLVNAVSAAILILCVGFVVKRLCFWYESYENPSDDGSDVPLPRQRLSPFFAMAAFAVVPQFASQVTSLSTFLPGLVPVFLSAAVVASLNSRRDAPSGQDAESAEDDDRRLFWLRLALAGALAAVSAWEGSFGVFFSPILLATTWFAFIRRGHTVSAVSAVWTLGFMTAFILEPVIVPDCPWSALLPHRFPLYGIVLFVFVCVIPLAVVRKFGERLWTMGVWALVLVVFAIITASTGNFARQSASERLARRIVADLGERKLIIGDGRFDVMIDEYKPADVRRIGTSSVAEKEFLVRFFESGDVVTNKLLSVRAYHNHNDPDYLAALEETGVVYRKFYDQETVTRMMKEQAKKLTKADKERISELRQKAFHKKADPLMESLHAMNEGYDDLPESLREMETRKAEENIRQGWKDGFGDTKLSTTLLSIDMRRANRKVLEADAVNALVIDRDDPAANSVLGQLRLEEGKLEDAEHYLRKGVKGGGVLAMSRLAMLLVNTGRSKEAEEWARKAVAIVPNDWNARQPLVAALVENGKSDEAKRELETMLDAATKADALKQAQAFATGVRARMRAITRPPRSSGK